MEDTKTKPDEQANELQWIKQQWVYMGRREGSTSPYVDAFMKLNDEGTKPDSPQALYFKAKGRHSGKTVGGVYEIEVTADGKKARIDSAKFLRTWHMEKSVLEWRAQHDACYAARELAAFEKKGKNLHLELLDPIRAVYRNASFTHRIAMELAVLRYIRHGVTKGPSNDD